VKISQWDGTEDQLDAIARLYADAFAEPPYDEDPARSLIEFPQRIRRYAAEKPEFRLRTATEDGDLVGFVLGTGIGPGDWWRDRLNATLAAPHRARWLEQQQFGVAELVVKPSHRRSGLGRALMNDVLDGLPYNSALLACYPDAVAPQRLYTSLGWTVIDPCLRVSASHPTQIMGIRLRPRTSRRITLPVRSSVEG
jgi:GNAT superfamily N-acetyltransferase